MVVSLQGHIVVRVAPGGVTFTAYLLDEDLVKPFYNRREKIERDVFFLSFFFLELKKP